MPKTGLGSSTCYAKPFNSQAGSFRHLHLLMLISSVDLDTRSGLKKVHADFSDIYRHLSDLYESNLRSDNITGGIIGIFAKMSADSILRDKLFEKGTTAFIPFSPLMERPGAHPTAHLIQVF